ncbi:MAG: hypothetical protein H0W25_05480 [Acidimicrobiia bacterium]|nr:hypothetical protein [Acidimicrobiia bacterium]
MLSVVVDASEIPVGERAWITITARNDLDAPVWWQSGGCGEPFDGVLTPDGAAPDFRSDFGGAPPPREWPGDPAGLTDWLAEHNVEEDQPPTQTDAATGHRYIGCPADSRASELAPGASLVSRHSVETRALPGALPAGGRYAVHVQFPVYADADLVDPLPTARATVPLRLLESDQRARSDGDAVSAFAGDPRLRGWLELTRPTTGASPQTWSTELSWWRGEWELWLTPRGTHAESLRLRYDPQTARVTDVRSVQGGRPAEDEPGARRPSGSRPDVVYP